MKADLLFNAIKIKNRLKCSFFLVQEMKRRANEEVILVRNGNYSYLYCNGKILYNYCFGLPIIFQKDCFNKKKLLQKYEMTSEFRKEKINLLMAGFPVCLKEVDYEVIELDVYLLMENGNFVVTGEKVRLRVPSIETIKRIYKYLEELQDEVIIKAERKNNFLFENIKFLKENLNFSMLVKNCNAGEELAYEDSNILLGNIYEESNENSKLTKIDFLYNKNAIIEGGTTILYVTKDDMNILKNMDLNIGELDYIYDTKFCFKEII